MTDRPKATCTLDSVGEVCISVVVLSGGPMSGCLMKDQWSTHRMWEMALQLVGYQLILGSFNFQSTTIPWYWGIIDRWCRVNSWFINSFLVTVIHFVSYESVGTTEMSSLHLQVTWLSTQTRCFLIWPYIPSSQPNLKRDLGWLCHCHNWRPPSKEPCWRLACPKCQVQYSWQLPHLPFHVLWSWKMGTMKKHTWRA